MRLQATEDRDTDADAAIDMVTPRTARPGTDEPSVADDLAAGAAVVPLAALLGVWLANKTITPAQAHRMHQPQTSVTLPPGPSKRAPAAAMASEAFGYLGGALMLAACVSFAAMVWRDVAVWQRLLIVGGAATVLVVAGAELEAGASAVAARLRSVLWTASSVAAFGFLMITGTDALSWSGQSAFLLAGAGTSVWTAALMWRSRTLLQHLSLGAASMLLAAGLGARLSDVDVLPGVAAWLVATTWFVLARAGALLPCRPVSVAAAVGAVVAAMTTFPSDVGILLALATAAAVIGVGSHAHDVVLLVVGALSLLQILPLAVGTWFPDMILAPLLLLVSGSVVVVGAVWGAGRGRRLTARSEGGSESHRETRKARNARHMADFAEHYVGGPAHVMPVEIPGLGRSRNEQENDGGVTEAERSEEEQRLTDRRQHVRPIPARCPGPARQARS